MNPNDPALQSLIDRVQAARDAGTRLRIRGGGSKDFYGGPPEGELLDTRVLTGTPSYEPSELVVTTRCGTPLAELEALLAASGQCLPFEPPHFGSASVDLAVRGATVGGMVAAGLAGPSRAAVGSVRDHLLGATLLNGRGEVLSFGGQVMKNVAGYDVSRLLAGSLGTLGLILEVSLKVLPVPPATTTLRLQMDLLAALDRLNEWGGKPLPLNASVWHGGQLTVRLRGAVAAVAAARTRIGGELVDANSAGPFWTGLRDHTDGYFVDAHAAVARGASLWRLSVPSTAPPLALASAPNASAPSGSTLIEWGGAQRWLCSTLPAATVREAARAVGGHATLFAAHDKSAGAFAPLAPPLMRIHHALKRSFDPAGIFNPGRLYADL